MVECFCIDIGEITNDITWNNFTFGVGVGVRYQLSVGLVRFDVAIPLIHRLKMDRDNNSNNILCFYINIGPEL